MAADVDWVKPIERRPTGPVEGRPPRNPAGPSPERSATAVTSATMVKPAMKDASNLRSSTSEISKPCANSASNPAVLCEPRP